MSLFFAKHKEEINEGNDARRLFLPNIWKKEKSKVMTMEAMVAGVKDHGEE